MLFFDARKPLRKHAGNPILTPQGEGWESRAVFNPTAWTDGETLYLLYRAEGPSDHPDRPFCSRIGLALSRDGFHFERLPKPVMEPTEPYEMPGGCEDPRLVRIGDRFYMTYTAFDGRAARLAMAVSEDLRTWEKWGLMLTDAQWARYFLRPGEEIEEFLRGWSKSGAILPQPLQGRYWMYFGDTNIWAAHSTDLRHWEVVDEPALTPRPDSFDSQLVEPGPPPVLLPEGIWLGYNSANADLHYAFGQALFSQDAPARLIHRSEAPLLTPTTPDEIDGQTRHVVFGEGSVLFKGKWLLYYGMADSRIGVAFCEA